MNKVLTLFKTFGPMQIICSDSSGTKFYYENGEIHRDDGPAIIRENGTLEYYVYGKRHREDGPAIICADGSYQYWLNGNLHREDGPACCSPDRGYDYYVNGKLLDVHSDEELQRYLKIRIFE